MSAERSYIMEVLHSVHRECVALSLDAAVAVVTELTQRVQESDNAQREIEWLYRRTGWDEFALRLLWMLERMRVEGRVPDRTLTAFGIEQLMATLPNSTNVSS
jgi:hypothetical protein